MKMNSYSNRPTIPGATHNGTNDECEDPACNHSPMFPCWRPVFPAVPHQTPCTRSHHYSFDSTDVVLAQSMEPNEPLSLRMPLSSCVAPNRNPASKKRAFSFCRVLLAFFAVAIVAILGYISIVLYYAAQPPQDSMEDSTFVKKEQSETGRYRTSLFRGLVTYDRMLSICDQIDREGSNDFDGVTFVGYVENNATFADLLKVFSDGSLPAEKRLVWTGCIWRWVQSRGSWELKCSNRDIYDYNTYCDKNWETELKELQSTTDHNEIIFIVKHYGLLRTACTKSMNAIQLTRIMGQPSGSVPELSFVCTLPNNLTTIMRYNNAIHEYLKMKVWSGNFLIYGVPATIEDAKRECHSQGYQLVTIDTPVKLVQVEDALRKDGSIYTEDDKFWTGGYFNVSSGDSNRAYLKWLGSPNTMTVYSDELFPDLSVSELDQSFKNIENSIKRCADQGRNCTERSILYVGLNFPKSVEESSRGLTVLNSYDDFSNRDIRYFYVICEQIE